MSIVTNPEEQKIRYAICQICPDFNSITKQCKKCGCFMIVKTRLDASTCKNNYWNDLEWREKVIEKNHTS